MNSACERMPLLIQADVDGELSAADAAEITPHLATCPDCAAWQARLLALSAALRAMPSESAPATLRARLPDRSRRAPLRRFAPWTAGLAMAAALALAVMPSRGGAFDDLVQAHIRAMQPGHLTDIEAGSHHTVRPWFATRTDFAPPVKDLSAAGYDLIGGRLDYAAGRPLAAIVYRAGQHLVDVFVWPEAGETGPVSASDRGFNVVAWRRDGFAFRAVSDLNAAELRNFALAWQAGP